MNVGPTAAAAAAGCAAVAALDISSIATQVVQMAVLGGARRWGGGFGGTATAVSLHQVDDDQGENEDGQHAAHNDGREDLLTHDVRVDDHEADGDHVTTEFVLRSEDVVPRVPRLGS